MKYLLDINVLIARTDPGHEFHVQVSEWFLQRQSEEFVLCPLVENGFIRIFGHPDYPGGPGSPDAAMSDLRAISSLPTVRFVSDSISARDERLFMSLHGITPRQLTDVYLLALAVENDAVFATLDGRVAVGAVRRGESALAVIESP